MPFCDKDGKYPVTCKSNAKRASKSGSVIYFAFASLPLFSRIVKTNFEFESELSSHAWLEIVLSVPKTVAVINATANTVPQRSVIHFDVDGLLSLKHTDTLVKLATDPSEFTVLEAYESILEFVDTYTTTRVARDNQK